MKTPKTDKRNDAGKTESGVDAGTKKVPAASEVSGKADLMESQIHKFLSFMALPLPAASDATMRRSVRKYGNPSSAQLVVLDVLDLHEEFEHADVMTLADLLAKAASDPRVSPALAQRFRERGQRLCSEWKSRVQQLQSDINFVSTDAAKQPKPILPGWKRGKLVLKQTPNGKIPAVFYYGKTAKREGITYTVADGMAWKIVCDLIHAEAYDGHGLELKKSPSDHFKRNHRLFFTQRMNHDGKFWYIKTV